MGVGRSFETRQQTDQQSVLYACVGIAVPALCLQPLQDGEGYENDEQLSMYDVLMKDDLSKEDIKKLKVVAKELLEKIKAQLTTMDHPFDKQETKASIIITIRDILWKELPESYSDESINYYRDAVYNYVSQHYGSVA